MGNTGDKRTQHRWSRKMFQYLQLVQCSTAEEGYSDLRERLDSPGYDGEDQAPVSMVTTLPNAEDTASVAKNELRRLSKRKLIRYISQFGRGHTQPIYVFGKVRFESIWFSIRAVKETD